MNKLTVEIIHQQTYRVFVNDGDELLAKEKAMKQLMVNGRFKSKYLVSDDTEVNVINDEKSIRNKN